MASRLESCHLTQHVLLSRVMFLVDSEPRSWQAGVPLWRTYRKHQSRCVINSVRREFSTDNILQAPKSIYVPNGTISGTVCACETKNRG